MPVLKSSSRMRRVVLLLTLLLPALPATAVEEVYQHRLKLLNRSGSSSLAQVAEGVNVAMLFQPDCDWCERQLADIDTLRQRCPEQLTAALIGVRANARQLKRELRHLNTSLPALRADNVFLRQLGAGEATPVTLFFDAQGKLLAKRRGYIPFDKLQRAVSLQTGGRCPS